MKTILIILTFIGFLTLGIFLDSLIINWLAHFLNSAGEGWVIFTKVVLWTIFSYFTGGPIFASAFIVSGAIKTTVQK